MSDGDQGGKAPVGREWLIARIAFALFVLAVFLWKSPSFEYCFHAIPKYESGQGPQGIFPFLFLFPSRYVGCVGIFLDANNALIAAIATAIVAFYTYTLWHVGSGQLAVTREQIELARQEFIATQRPRVMVQAVLFAAYGVNGGESRVEFAAINAGESDATILSYSAFPYTQSKGSPFTPFKGTNSVRHHAEITLVAGHRTTLGASSGNYHLAIVRPKP
jgi:hypothetical protein